MITGYAVGVPEENGKFRVYGIVARTLEEGKAVLTVAKLDYPLTYKDAKLYELREVEG